MIAAVRFCAKLVNALSMAQKPRPPISGIQEAIASERMTIHQASSVKRTPSYLEPQNVRATD
jgi:hypothetical protein